MHFFSMRLKTLFLLAVLVINSAASAIYTGYMVRTGERAVIKNLDDRLLSVAYGSEFLLGPYTDTITGNRSVSDEDYKNILVALAEFAKNTHVEYVYSVTLHAGKIVFTSDAATRKEIDEGNYSKFFEEYADASEGLKNALRDKKIHYDAYADTWGRHRSIFLPATSPGGVDYMVGVDIGMNDVNRLLKKVQMESLFIGAFIFALSSLAVLFISRAVARPLSVLTGVAADIAGGDLDREVPPVKSVREVAELADAFRRMKTSLKEHIEQLIRTTAAKERIESELNIAHTIQMSILPKIFPPFPDKPDAFDLHAVIKPAKEVGGDFYDFFYIDDTHFCFVVGDVSGKGVPASLFMAVTKTLIKGHAAGVTDPGEILSAVNDDLNDENDACMFVTVFLAILDTKTGEIRYANGGHNPPVIVNAAGIAEFLDVPGDIVVGAVEGFAYHTATTTLGPDDAILLYTDGVTEAMNPRNAMFSEARLMETLNAPGKKGVKETISRIMEDTTRFAGEAPQSDDVTLLMLRFKGPGNHAV